MGINRKKSKVILIITACILPNNVCTDYEIKIGSIKKRLKNYLYTIENIELKIFDEIYFIDNSEYEINCAKELYKSIKKNKINFIHFNPSRHSHQKGKGYQESEMINYILKNHKKETRFLKITGTIPLIKLSKFIKTFEREFDKNDNKIFSSYYSPLNRKIDTRFFYTTKKIWFDFSENFQKLINDKCNIYLEHCIFIFCKVKKVKVKLFYPDIPKKIFYTGNGDVYRNNKIVFYICKFFSIFQ